MGIQNEEIAFKLTGDITLIELSLLYPGIAPGDINAGLISRTLSIVVLINKIPIAFSVFPNKKV